MAYYRFIISTCLQRQIGQRATLPCSRLNLRALVVGVLALVVVAGSGSRSFAQQLGAVSGIVSDPQGARMPNVRIRLRWNVREASGGIIPDNRKGPRKTWQAHKEWLLVNTDSAGQFSIKVPAGNWDVFAYLDGFAPSCTVVSVEPDKTIKIELRLAFAPMSID
jgi:hypothetical protein